MCIINVVMNVKYCDSRPESLSIGVWARRPLPVNGWTNVFPSTTRIGAHCYATLSLFHCWKSINTATNYGLHRNGLLKEKYASDTFRDGLLSGRIAVITRNKPWKRDRNTTERGRRRSGPAVNQRARSREHWEIRYPKRVECVSCYNRV
jgi:hypothetical protein